MTNELNQEKCVNGQRHRFATDRHAGWIEAEGSYQVWGQCINRGCDRCAWFVLSVAPVVATVSQDAARATGERA